jgi:hypothetical protein
MTNLMLPLKPGYPDMEIKEHQRIVFHMAETIKDGLTAFVLTNITLFVRVISVKLTNNNNQKNKYGLVAYCIHIMHAPF